MMDWYDARLRGMSSQVNSIKVPTRLGQTHVIEAGTRDKPTLVVLHGMNMNAPAMSAAVLTFAATHHVYAIDIIGMPGRSAPSRPPRNGDAYAHWLAEVMNALHLSSASFLGLSFGGWLTLRLAALSPERITKAVLIDSGGLTPLTFKGQAIAGWSAMRYKQRPSRRNLERAAQHPFYAAGCEPDPGIVNLIGLGYRHVRFDLDPKGLPLLPKRDLLNYRAPTLVLFGEHDVFFNAERGVARARSIIPNLITSGIIAGQGHLLGLRGEANVYARVTRFLTAKWD